METTRKLLLACGALSVIVYVTFAELAALQWAGYSRMSQAISELSSIGAPSRSLLVPWLTVVYTPVVVAFGIGIWRSAGPSRAVRIIGGLLVVYGLSGPLWLPFPMTPRANIEPGATMPLDDIMHIALSVVTAITWLGAIVAGLFIGSRMFRRYSLATLISFVTLSAMTFVDGTRLAAGEPTPILGLIERAMFGVFFAWLVALGFVLWHPPHAKRTSPTARR